MTFDTNALNKKILELFESEKYEDAIEILDKDIERTPKEAGLWIGKGFALFKLERYEDALKVYEKVIKINPESAVIVCFLKGIALFELERFEDAIKAFDKATGIPRDWGAYLYLWKGIALFELERDEDAIKAFDKAIELQEKEIPKSGLPYLFKGISLKKLGIYEDAIKAFDKAIEINPEKYIYWSIKGAVFYNFGKYEEAVNAFDKAIEINPKDVSVHINLGKLFFDLGNLEGSSKKVKDALDIDENCLDALCLQGIIKIEEQDYKGAKDSFRKAVSLDIGNTTILLWEAYADYLNAEFSQGVEDEKYQEKIVSIIRRLERVEKLFERQAQEETRAYILYLLGYLYYKNKDIFTARDKLEECVRLKSNSSIKPADELLRYIWNNQIRPSCFEWWWYSPLDHWIKRIGFSILSLVILALFWLYPFINMRFYNLNLYIFFILLLIIIVIFPILEGFKVQDIEIQMRPRPPFEFVLSPAMIEEKIKELELMLPSFKFSEEGIKSMFK